MGVKVLYIIFGSSCYALSQLISKKNIAKLDPVVFSAQTGIFVFTAVLGFAMYSGNVEPLQPLSFPYAALALVFEALPILLIYAAYKRAGVAKVQIIRSGFPFAVVVYSFLLFREIVHIHQLASGTLITLVVMVMAYGEIPLKNTILSLLSS